MDLPKLPEPVGGWMSASRAGRFEIKWKRAQLLGRAYSIEQFEFEEAHERALHRLESRVNLKDDEKIESLAPGLDDPAMTGHPTATRAEGDAPAIDGSVSGAIRSKQLLAAEVGDLCKEPVTGDFSGVANDFTAQNPEPPTPEPGQDAADPAPVTKAGKESSYWDDEFNPTQRLLIWPRFRVDRSARNSRFFSLVADGHVSFSIRPLHTPLDVVTKIAEAAKLPIESLPDDLNAPLQPRARVIFGYVGDELEQIARDYGNMRWWISDQGLNMAILSADELRPGKPVAASGEREAQAKPSLATLLHAQTLPTQKLAKMYEAVIRYKWYLRELRTLKVASKKYQTPDLLKKQFPDLEVWAALDKADERDIANGRFDPGRFSWALLQRLNSRSGKDDRTLQNYRKVLRQVGISI